MNQDSMFECPICCRMFDKERCPMVICMSQHTACKACVEDMFRGRNKSLDQILCYLCRRPVRYTSVTPFYWLNELIQTKQSLRRQGSKIHKINGSLTNDIKQLREQNHKQKQKNEWLLQMLDQSKQKNAQIQKLIKEVISIKMDQLKKEMKEEKMMQQLQNKRVMESICCEYRQSFKKQYLKRDQTIKLVQEGREENKKLHDITQKKIEGIQTDNKNVIKQINSVENNLSTLSNAFINTIPIIEKSLKNIQLNTNQNERRLENSKSQKIIVNPKEKSQKLAVTQKSVNEAAKERVANNKVEIKPSPFVKKSIDIKEIESAPSTDRSLKTLTNSSKPNIEKNKIQNKLPLLKNERIKTDISIDHSQQKPKNAYVPYQLPSYSFQPPSYNRMRQTMGPLDFKAQFQKENILNNPALEKINTANFTSRKNEEASKKFHSRPLSQSMTSIQIQEELKAQTKKKDQFMSILRRKCLCSRVFVPSDLIQKFVEENIFLEEQELLQKFKKVNM